MATDATKVLVGAGVMSIGDYVAAGGAGTLTDVGHVKEATTLTPAFESYLVNSERSFGPIKSVPLNATYSIQVSMQETTAERLRIATRQPAANKTGTPPDETLLIGDPVEQYHQIQIVAPGPGTTATRTLTFWRCQVQTIAAIPFAKGAEQMYQVTFQVFRDDSVTTADKYGKQVDS